ncbi:LysR family transcriptional regulator [Parasphingopyxis marina]|uniref:LysR family transcriptional regulator n=1 Tax=Parasphingopyxis marina TaxID=2761622 RepID=A0A842HVZ9_9SPHN|nr:LysR family transcriptional regulator [Parasphingopyxis marina]MBC2777142.1 LysR family transcriptional regulator [Parasphingopyxis marina]
MRRGSDFAYLMQVFCTVVREGSFTGAAQALGTKSPSVSKAVAKLEEELGVKLLLRSTRSMSLSEPGEYLYREGTRLNERLASVRSAVGSFRETPKGRLTITASVAVGQNLIGPVLPAFMEAYPDISVELRLTDALLDIRSEGIDLALRSTPILDDSALFSKRISQQRRLLVAAPSYLQRRGVPKAPTDLADHAALVFKGNKLFDWWELTRHGKAARVRVKPAFISNNYMTIVQGARDGVGIANVFAYLAGADLESGTLCPLLPDYELPVQNIFALYHQRRELSPKLDAFLDHLERAGSASNS